MTIEDRLMRIAARHPDAKVSFVPLRGGWECDVYTSWYNTRSASGTGETPTDALAGATRNLPAVEEYDRIADRRNDDGGRSKP